MLIASLILFQVFVFAGLIYMFRRIMTRNVTSATKHLEELNQDYAKKEQEINRRLEEAEQKSQDILGKAEEEAERVKAQIVKDMESERDKILKQSHIQSDETIQQAEKSRQLILSEINERVAGQAIGKACELIQNALPEQFKQDVHSHWIEELIESGFNQLERLHIPKEIQEIKIVSAFPLNQQQRERLGEKLKQLLKHGITLKEEIDSKIVVGIIVAIGSLVLDGSLKNKIQKQAKSMSERE